MLDKKGIMENSREPNGRLNSANKQETGKSKVSRHAGQCSPFLLALVSVIGGHGIYATSRQSLHDVLACAGFPKIREKQSGMVKRLRASFNVATWSLSYRSTPCHCTGALAARFTVHVEWLRVWLKTSTLSYKHKSSKRVICPCYNAFLSRARKVPWQTKKVLQVGVWIAVRSGSKASI